MKKMFIAIFLPIIILLSGCNDKLDIQRVYEFNVTNMPVKNKLKVGETAEIRLRLHREGRFEETKYFVRYFQPDGKGILTMQDGTIFMPNDLYNLNNEEFRLYYTSQSEDRQTIDLYFEDNFAQIRQMSFNFNNDNSRE